MSGLLLHFTLDRNIASETPVPFEVLDGMTYDTKEVHTAAGKTDRSGWPKRQAMFILYIRRWGSTYEANHHIPWIRWGEHSDCEKGSAFVLEGS